MSNAHAARQATLYGDIWEHDPNYGTAQHDVEDTVVHRIAPHMRRLYPHRPVDVVDFGAGDGRFLWAMYDRGLISRATGVDLYEPQKLPGWMSWRKQPLWRYNALSADYAISTDALEHLPPELVSTALAEIRASAPRGFLRISLKEDRYGTERGLHLHESVFSSAEWLIFLRDRGIEPTSYRVYLEADGREGALEVYF